MSNTRPHDRRENGCARFASGTVDLYFYDELTGSERDGFDRHLPACPQCRHALEDLTVIREALAERPVVSGPPSGDWSAFMTRLDAAVSSETPPRLHGEVVPFERVVARPRRLHLPLLAAAALLALVTMSVMFLARSRDNAAADVMALGTANDAAASAGDTTPGDTGGLSAVSQQHLERSKLVLLGLANKDAERTAGSDWTYERELAARLLTDTRLYRQAAEARGLDTLAQVMRDLELVLLQTSMTEGEDPAALSQIQRAIRKRDLLQKMDVVRTTTGI